MAHLRGQVIWEFQVDILYTLVSLIVVVRFKRWKAAAKLKAKDAQAPDVDPTVMRLLHYHLWR